VNFPVKSQLLTLLLLASSAVGATDPAQLTAARALLDARKFAESAAAFRKLAAAEPANAELHYLLGLSLGRHGDTDAAVKALEKAVELAPKNATYRHDLGDQYGTAAQKAGVLSKFGLAKKCLAEYQRAAELDPANVGHHQSLFEYYRQAPGIAGGGVDKAEAEAATILKLDPMRGHTAYATLYTGEKKFDRALQHAAEIRKLDPVRGRGAFVTIYFETKQYDLALAEFDEALKLSPDDYGTLYQLGRFAALTGQALDRGLAAMRRCLELPPAKEPPGGHAAVQWRIGNILEKKNDPAGARAAYQAALKLDPNFTQAAEALKKLK
jgi:tetratricopeptide (TPR) repeat protein